MIELSKRTGPLRKLPNSLAITPGVGIEGVWISLEIPARKRSLELSYIEPGSEGGGRRRSLVGSVAVS